MTAKTLQKQQNCDKVKAYLMDIASELKETDCTAILNALALRGIDLRGKFCDDRKRNESLCRSNV